MIVARGQLESLPSLLSSSPVTAGCFPRGVPVFADKNLRPSRWQDRSCICTNMLFEQWADFWKADFLPATDLNMPVVIRDAQFFLGKLREMGFDTYLLEQWIVGVQLDTIRLEELHSSLKGVLILGDKLATEAKITKSIQLMKSQRDQCTIDFDMDYAD
ncbi:hypothetical protein H6P81_015934 [Aristolochia fimbriata]|uniref:Uncharacterized protein n=1 Tax=Aristolochia fimbriata TaxID=158543 RepID=A0AAV7E8N1_ARIFI|nr:hypothetical protein H6P81_015934 [Aristolochia fimbriata]